MPVKRSFCFILIFFISINYYYQCFAQADALPYRHVVSDSSNLNDLPKGNSTLVITADQQCMIMVDGVSHGIFNADETKNIIVQKGEHKIMAKTVDATSVLTKQIITVDENASKVVDLEILAKAESPVATATLAAKTADPKPSVQLPMNDMVYVEGGTFTMGCTSEQTDCWENEKLTHQVSVSSFYIAAHEMTIAGFKQFIDSSRYKTDAEKTGYSFIMVDGNWQRMDSVDWRCDEEGKLRPASDWNHPVMHVSWNDANAYCRWLSRMSGKTFRLPTEAEWEFASRGGNKTYGFKFSGGNIPAEICWYADNSESGAHAVGLKVPNELGLYDMSGNVWEWCNDWISDYTSAALIDPKGAETGNTKILRGGSWLSYYWSVRTTNRNDYDPSSTCSVNGFRVVMETR